MAYKPNSGRTQDALGRSLEALLSPSRLATEQLAFKLDGVPPPRPDLTELWTPDDIYSAICVDSSVLPIQFREDNRIEWKSARIEPKDLPDYFSMWANTQPEGGIIVVGVEKNGDVTGCLHVGMDRVQQLERVAYEQCSDAKFELRRVAARKANGEPDFLLIFRVYYHPDKLVETVRGEAFVRLTDRKRRLHDDEKREIRINKGQIGF